MQADEEYGVQVSDTDAIRTVHLDRPAKLNAFNRDQYRGLRRALDAVSEDSETACVILTGTGRAFSAGSDLDDKSSAAEEDNPYQDCIELVEEYPKPLIVAVNGLAVGIGITILGHADLVLAGLSARFQAPFASLGLVPEAGSTATMSALLGSQHTAHLFFTGEWLSAEQAQQRGLVWRVVADDKLVSETRHVATQVAQMPIDSLVAIKKLLLSSRLEAARNARRREDAEFSRLLDGPAHHEALTKFRQRSGHTSG